MLEYIKFGEAPYKLLLIHGFPSNYTVWDNIIPELSKTTSGIAVNMPGVGSSPTVPKLSLDIIADKIIEVIDAEQMEAIHLVGHSMGGYTALNLVQKCNKIAGLTLLHSGANADSEERARNRIKSIALMEKGEFEKGVFITAMFKNFFEKQFTTTHPDIIKKYIDIGKKMPLEVVVGLFSAILERQDSFDFIRNTAMPIQYILGTEDTATPLNEILPQAAMPQKCMVNIYQHCGHGAFEERPEELTRDLLAFHQYLYSGN